MSIPAKVDEPMAYRTFIILNNRIRAHRNKLRTLKKEGASHQAMQPIENALVELAETKKCIKSAFEHHIKAAQRIIDQKKELGRRQWKYNPVSQNDFWAIRLHLSTTRRRRAAMYDVVVLGRTFEEVAKEFMWTRQALNVVMHSFYSALYDRWEQVHEVTCEQD